MRSFQGLSAKHDCGSPRAESKEYFVLWHFRNYNLTSEVPHISTIRLRTQDKGIETLCAKCATGEVVKQVPLAFCTCCLYRLFSVPRWKGVTHVCCRLSEVFLTIFFRTLLGFFWRNKANKVNTALIPNRVSSVKTDNAANTHIITNTVKPAITGNPTNRARTASIGISANIANLIYTANTVNAASTVSTANEAKNQIQQLYMILMDQIGWQSRLFSCNFYSCTKNCYWQTKQLI